MKFLLFIIIGIVLIGLICPFLISAKNSLMVIGGVSILLGYGVSGYYFFKEESLLFKLLKWRNKNEKN